MLMMVEQGKFNTEKYEAIIKHGETVLKQWFKFNNWQWQGYKETYKSMRLYSTIYSNLPNFSQKIQWIDGDCQWEDYHLIIQENWHEAKHKSFEDWKKFYQTQYIAGKMENNQSISEA